MKPSTIQREDAPLLLDEPTGGEEAHVDVSQHGIISNWQLAGLYTTHTLSMWNSRSYEFAAVLFTTSAYPHTLIIASLRGVTANLASLLFSTAVGRWCNQYPSRLRTLQFCIVSQRICICIACLGWAMIVQTEGVDPEGAKRETKDKFQPAWLKHAIMAACLILGMLEKLSWVGYLVVMERDWVPILANDTSKPALHVLNANVKRIQLIAKLVAPLAVSGFTLWVKNISVTALVIATMQLTTVVPEVLASRGVWKSASVLQQPKEIKIDDTMSSERGTLTKKLATWIHLIRRYISSPVCVPSIVWTIQPMSVLTLSASMMIYLLSIHFPLEHITVGSTLSTGVEISSTIVTPLLISFLRRRARNRDKDSHHLQPLITVGLLGLSWQLFTLVPAVVSLLILSSLPTDPTRSFPVLTKVLLISLGLSRLGPFAYSLVEQQLVQVAIPADRRVEFSGTEMALFSLAELCRWGLTGIFGKPEQFKVVAVVSFGAIATAAVSFWWWTWKWKTRLRISDVGDNSSSNELIE